MLGKREANIYGSESLDDLYKRIDSLGLDAEIEYFKAILRKKSLKRFIVMPKKSTAVVFLTLEHIHIQTLQ